MLSVTRTFIVPDIADGYTPVAGLLDSQFVKRVFINGQPIGNIPVIIESPAGYYEFSYIFCTKGSWQIFVENSTHKFREVYSFDVTSLTTDDQRPRSL